MCRLTQTQKGAQLHAKKKNHMLQKKRNLEIFLTCSPIHCHTKRQVSQNCCSKKFQPLHQKCLTCQHKVDHMVSFILLIHSSSKKKKKNLTNSLAKNFKIKIKWNKCLWNFGSPIGNEVDLSIAQLNPYR